jgi:hypothetical protein
MKLWEPGQVIVVREVWCGKIYSAMPHLVVRDSESLSALYLPPGTPCLWPHTRAGETIRIPTNEWVLDGEAWTTSDVLNLVQPGSGYTVTAFWDEKHIFDHWKINLEEPMRRTPIGFDYMDQMLDIIIDADRSTWHWKDEDELEEAQTRGIFSAQQAHEIRARGERVLQSMQANQPPFDGGWEDWKPEPAWRTPLELPQGWDSI